MNDFGTGLIIGIFIGDILGVALMSLLALARDTKPPKREPTKLWLSGNICKYKGEVYTVVAMTTDEDQTFALLENDQSETIAPIEELEAVEE